MRRLKTRAQFLAVLSSAPVSKSAHFALHKLTLDSAAQTDNLSLFPGSGTWLGAMAPKRWAKRAVTRNAIKRQVFTLGTKLESTSGSEVFLVRLRKSFSTNEFFSASSAVLKQAVCKELQGLLQDYPQAT